MDVEEVGMARLVGVCRAFHLTYTDLRPPSSSLVVRLRLLMLELGEEGQMGVVGERCQAPSRPRPNGVMEGGRGESGLPVIVDRAR